MDDRPPPQTTEIDAAHEMGFIIRALYVALGGATLLHDRELIEDLTPIVLRYRAKTREALEGTPYE